MCDGQDTDQDIRLDLRWLAGTLLSPGGPKEVLAEVVRVPILDYGDQRFVLSHPIPRCVRRWSEQVPDDFVFAWKASKFITHWKRLSENSRNSIELMDTRLKVLGRKAGPVLFQLPSHF